MRTAEIAGGVMDRARPYVAGAAAILALAGCTSGGSDKSEPKPRHPTTTTTTTPGPTLPGQTDKKGDPYFGNFRDGYQIDCGSNVTVKATTPENTLFKLTTQGVDPNSLMFSYVYEANVDYNAKTNGIDREAFTHLHPGDEFSVLSDCVLTSPVFAGYNGHHDWYTKSYQSDNSFYYIDAEKNKTTYCQPQPACEEQIH